MEMVAEQSEDMLLRDVVEIESRVRVCLRGRLHDFRLLRHDRGVILLGRAPNYYVKQLAQHAVMKVAGVTIVANQIAVP
jgi:osmotically-inducible protein OsmY